MSFGDRLRLDVTNPLTQESVMTVQEIVDSYYDAWQNRAGDFSDVPLAEDFRFTGPVASFDSAEGFRAMARSAGAAVTRFEVRHQFADGDRVCSIVDWEMSLPVAPMTAAEILEVSGGRLVRGELIYDAEELRAVVAQAG
jgi:ketosteroid isomerase-like protein